jgi:hypothetical protein
MGMASLLLSHREHIIPGRNKTHCQRIHIALPTLHFVCCGVPDVHKRYHSHSRDVQNKIVV